MKRNWIGALAAILFAGGAIALAQQTQEEAPATLNRTESASSAREAVNLLNAQTRALASDQGGAATVVNGQTIIQRAYSADGSAPATALPFAQGASRGAITSGAASYAGQRDIASSGLMPPPPRPQTKEMEKYQQAELQARQSAQRLRQLPSDSPSIEKAREDLKAAVTAAFEARQAMQQAEIKRLKEKLAEIEAHVQRREEAKDVLIAERVYELSTNGPEFFLPPEVPSFYSPVPSRRLVDPATARPLVPSKAAQNPVPGVPGSPESFYAPSVRSQNVPGSPTSPSLPRAMSPFAPTAPDAQSRGATPANPDGIAPGPSEPPASGNAAPTPDAPPPPPNGEPAGTDAPPDPSGAPAPAPAGGTLQLL